MSSRNSSRLRPGGSLGSRSRSPSARRHKKLAIVDSEKDDPTNYDMSPGRVQALERLLLEKKREISQTKHELKTAALLGQGLLDKNAQIQFDLDRVVDDYRSQQELLSQTRYDLQRKTEYLIQLGVTDNDVISNQSDISIDGASAFNFPIRKSESVMSNDIRKLKIKDLEIENEDLKEERTMLLEETRKLEDQLQITTKRFEEDQSYNTARNQELERQLELVASEESDAKTKITKLIEELVESQRQRNFLLEENEELRVDVEAVQEKELRLMKEAQELNDIYQEAMDELHRVNDERDEARADLKRLQNNTTFSSTATVTPMNNTLDSSGGMQRTATVVERHAGKKSEALESGEYEIEENCFVLERRRNQGSTSSDTGASSGLAKVGRVDSQRSVKSGTTDVSNSTFTRARLEFQKGRQGFANLQNEFRSMGRFHSTPSQSSQRYTIEDTSTPTKSIASTIQPDQFSTPINPNQNHQSPKFNITSSTEDDELSDSSSKQSTIDVRRQIHKRHRKNLQNSSNNHEISKIKLKDALQNISSDNPIINVENSDPNIDGGSQRRFAEGFSGDQLVPMGDDSSMRKTQSSGILDIVMRTSEQYQQMQRMKRGNTVLGDGNRRQGRSRYSSFSGRNNYPGPLIAQNSFYRARKSMLSDITGSVQSLTESEAMTEVDTIVSSTDHPKIGQPGRPGTRDLQRIITKTDEKFDSEQQRTLNPNSSFIITEIEIDEKTTRRQRVPTAYRSFLGTHAGGGMRQVNSAVRLVKEVAGSDMLGHWQHKANEVLYSGLETIQSYRPEESGPRFQVGHSKSGTDNSHSESSTPTPERLISNLKKRQNERSSDESSKASGNSGKLGKPLLVHGENIINVNSHTFKRIETPPNSPTRDFRYIGVDTTPSRSTFSKAAFAPPPSLSFKQLIKLNTNRLGVYPQLSRPVSKFTDDSHSLSKPSESPQADTEID